MDPQNAGKKKDLKKGVIIGVLAALVILALLFFAVYKIGVGNCNKTCGKKLADQEKKYIKKLTDQDKKLVDCVKAKKPKLSKKQPAKKPVKKPILRQVVPVVIPPVVVGDVATVTPAPTPAVALAPAPVPIAAMAPAQRGYTIRLNVVECKPQYIGTDFSRNIGPYIRKGMANGTIRNTSTSVTFKVEFRKGGARLAGKNIFVNGELKSLPANFSDGWAIEVTTRNGQATISVDPSLIGEETELSVQAQGVQMTAPPNGLPLVTNKGELRRQVDAGVQETFLHFIKS